MRRRMLMSISDDLITKNKNHLETTEGGEEI